MIFYRNESEDSQWDYLIFILQPRKITEWTKPDNKNKQLKGDNTKEQKVTGKKVSAQVGYKRTPERLGRRFSLAITAPPGGPRKDMKIKMLQNEKGTIQ